MIKIPQTMSRSDLLALKDDPNVDWRAECVEVLEGDFTISLINEYKEQQGDEEIMITECVGDTEQYEVRIEFRPSIEGGKTEISAHCISAGGDFGFGSM